MHEQKIIEALSTIKAICTNTSCSDCPFSTVELDCGITAKAPENWKMKEKTPFRAFEQE